MSFSIGIIGLPNAGKSTLFKALTKNPVDIASYPFTTIQPNKGIVAVPDQRLKKIAEIVKPEKTTPTIIEFIDIAGLIKNAHKGEGLGNQFLAHIRECDAVLEIVRIFVQNDVEHPEKYINPQRDIEIIKTELIMKDIETIEKVLNKEKTIERQTLFKKIKENLNKGIRVADLHLSQEEVSQIKELNLLTAKPLLRVFNINSQSKIRPQGLCLDLKLEKEISELKKSELKELGLKSQLDQLILSCYNILDLITFYTITGGREVRAWTLKKNSTAPEAGKVVHSDFKEKFIKAIVIPWQKLVQAGSLAKAREKGLLQTVGKEYKVQDGDIIEFKI